MSNPEPSYWSCSEGDDSPDTDPDDAIEYYLNGYFYGEPRDRPALDILPETVTLRGYAPIGEADEDGLVELVEVCSEQVNVADWVRENSPGWLEDR